MIADLFVILSRLLLAIGPGWTPHGSGDDEFESGECPHPGCGYTATVASDLASGHCPRHGWFVQGECPLNCGLFAARLEPGVVWRCEAGHDFDAVLCPYCRSVGLWTADDDFRCSGSEPHPFTVEFASCPGCARFGNMAWDDHGSVYRCEACRRTG
jgi:hypothetical protein